jgi:glutamyl-tRNA reductase
VDIVICATGAPHYVISKDDIEAAVHHRMNRPMFLIDITVPRNIDPAVKDVDNAYVFDIDELKAHVGHNQEERLKEAETAECADSHPVYDDAVSFTVSKARQIIDQMGERLFD